jgi:hypothetical protein
MHARHNRHQKRQEPVPSGEGLNGVTTVDTAEPAAPTLIIATGTAPVGTLEAAPSLAAGITVTSSVAATISPSAIPSATQPSQALKGSSSLSTSAVVAACVGSFIGLAILICVFIWWTRHSSTKKSRGVPRSPMSENRNTRGEMDQQKTRSGAWNKLDSAHGHESAMEDEDEKNFSMFKKRTMSMRTTRTAKALEEHGFDMPPITKYHPDLAQQLAQPDRPFAQRQESGVSWGGDTVGDESFLSLRSVRIESGTMSPTFGMAKMTPPAVASPMHKWESAEVLTLEEHTASHVEVQNPFTDVPVMERRKSSSNPFFSASEMHRTPSRRSRSSSGGYSHSRNASKSRRSSSRSRIVSQGSQIDPFADIHNSPEITRDLPPFTRAFSHTPSDSSTSITGNSLSSERAMKSLIAALDLTQEEIEERLRVVSMQPTLDSRYSSIMQEMEDDIAKNQASVDTYQASSSRR